MKLYYLKKENAKNNKVNIYNTKYCIDNLHINRQTKLLKMKVKIAHRMFQLVNIIKIILKKIFIYIYEFLIFIKNQNLIPFIENLIKN